MKQVAVSLTATGVIWWVVVQAVLVRISARLLKKTLLRTDERAKLEGELLDGIDVVKCMTWEVSLLEFLFVH